MAEIQWLNGLYEGRGINAATGEMFQQAIDFPPLMTVGSGQTPKLELKIISSSKQLAELLSVDASASLRVKMRGNVSAQARFSEQQKINSYYQYALVTVSVTNPTQMIKNPVLKKDALELLKTSGWKEFAKSYGTEFVEGYITGGYYHAVIEIQTTDSSKQQDTAAKLSGSYSGFGVNANVTAEAQKQIKTALQDQTINVSVCQAGGSGDPLEVTLDEMIRQAMNFPQLIKDAPVIMTAITNTYKKAVPIPIKPKDSVVFWTEQANILDELGQKYLELDDYRSNLEFLLKNLDKVGEFDVLERDKKRGEFKQSLKETNDVIDDLIKKAKACSADDGQCKTYVYPDTFKFLPLPGDDSMITQQILSGNSLFEFSPAHEFRNGTTGDRVDTKHISFSKIKFKTPPNVVVSLKEIDVDKNRGIRVNVFPINITTDGFDLAYKTWSDSVVYAIDATWFAYGS